MSMNIAQFIQTIATLRGLQAQDKELDIRKSTADDAEYARTIALLKDAPMEARNSILEGARNRLPSKFDSLTQFARLQNESAGSVKERLAIQGLGPDGGAGMAPEIASAMFTGQNRGTLSQSGLLASLLPQTPEDIHKTFGDTMTKYFQSGLINHLTTGLTPGQSAIDLQTANAPQPQLQSAAAIQRGQQLNAGQVQQGQNAAADRAQQRELGIMGINQRSVEAAGQQATQLAGISAQLAAVREKTGMTLNTQADLMKQADVIAEQLGKGSSNAPLQKMYVAQWNQYMDMLGHPERKLHEGDDIPTKVGGFRAMLRSLLGSGDQVETSPLAQPQGAPPQGNVYLNPGRP